MITTEQVKNTAQLARVAFSEQEIKELQKELSSILDYFNKLEELDLEGVEPASHSVGIENAFREDKTTKREAEMTKKLLELAPRTKNHFIKVKPIL